MSAGRWAIPTAAATTSGNTFRERCTWTFPLSWRNPRSPPAGGIRCRRPNSFRRPHGAGASAKATLWSPTTTPATRPPPALWWMLRNAGFGSVYLLDGGLAAWRRAGLPLQGRPEQAAPGDVTLTDGGMPVIDARASRRTGPTHGVLLDARAGERYRGEVEPVDPRAGHIPGAVSAPTTENLDDAGRFLPARGTPAPLRPPGSRRSDADGGVLRLRRHGRPRGRGTGNRRHPRGAVPGSFSEWSNDPSLPVATGAGARLTCDGTRRRPACPTGTGPAARGSVAV